MSTDPGASANSRVWDIIEMQAWKRVRKVLMNLDTDPQDLFQSTVIQGIRRPIDTPLTHIKIFVNEQIKEDLR